MTFIRLQEQMQTKKALENVKVADFSWAATGPQVTRELAEHGAEVIRVESHRRPDMTRLSGPFKDGIAGVNRGPNGSCFNTNKYSISLDLSKHKGREVALNLVRWADIVADSMRPGTMKKWGLDYNSVKKISPDIIYFSTTMQGQYGPHAREIGYGTQASCLTGFSDNTGWPDRPPVNIYGAYTDFIAPFYLVCYVLAALDRKRKTGKGIYLDESAFEASVTFLSPAILDYTVNKRIPTRMGNHDPYIGLHGCYRCQGNDRWCVIAVQSSEEWKSFSKAIGEPDWTKEPRFATSIGRIENAVEIDRLVEEWTQNYTPERVMQIMQSSGVPAGVVQSSRDLFDDPQLKHRRHFQWLEHNEMGSMAYNSPAYRLSKTPCELVKAGPTLGDDNEYVFKEILGYSDDEIADFLAEGIITTEADLPEIKASS